MCAFMYSAVFSFAILEHNLLSTGNTSRAVRTRTLRHVVGVNSRVFSGNTRLAMRADEHRRRVVRAARCCQQHQRSNARLVLTYFLFVDFRVLAALKMVRTKVSKAIKMLPVRELVAQGPAAR